MTEDFQRRAGEQGRDYEALVENLLTFQGFTIVARHWHEPNTRVEIDFVIKRSDFGEIWVECKGSYESTRNGLERTDTLKKAIGSAAVLKTLDEAARRPYWLLTSHFPKADSAGDIWLRAVRNHFDRVIETGLGLDWPEEYD